MRESYKIDTVSNLYPAVGGHIFRLCAVFKRAIDKERLAKALKSLQIDFPIIFSHLEKTFYSYIHISAADLDIIEDGDPFMRPPQMFDTEKPSLRMYVKGELLSMDIFHGNADGRAASQFFNALLRNYALLLDSEPLPKPLPAKKEDLLDPYPVCYERVRPASFFGKESYRIRLPLPETPYMRFSCVSVDLNALKGVTARLGITVNDFFCAALYQAIADATDARRSGLPVSLSVSIDLRPAFGSHTQRNFSYYTNVCISPGDAPDFEGAARHIHEEVKRVLHRENLLAGIAAAHKTANNLFMRSVPRALKELGIRCVYRFVAGNSITSTVSNVGYQALSDETAKHIERLEIYLGAGPGGINTAATGFGDKAFFCFSCGSHDRRIEKKFTGVLDSYSIPCSVSEREYEKLL